MRKMLLTACIVAFSDAFYAHGHWTVSSAVGPSAVFFFGAVEMKHLY